MNNPALEFPTATRPRPAGGILQGLRPISAAQFQAVPAAPSRVIRPETWVLEMFTAGGLEINAGRAGWRRRGPGTGVLYAPGADYRERRDGRSPQGYASLYVCFEDDSGELAPLPAMERRFCWIDDDGRLLERLLWDVVTGLDGGPAAALAAMGSLYQTVSLLLAAEARRDSLVIGPREAAIPAMIATVHRYIREHLAEPIRLADLAACADLSESALSHAYKRITGRTPMDALRRLRVEAAKGHLVRGHLKLQTIAELTGFADAFHLSRTFKRVTGRSPRTFKSQG